MGLRFWKTREFGTAIVLAAMLVACEIASQVNTHSSFLFSPQLGRILDSCVFVALAAIGACIVIISGGVDLSAGSVMTLSAMIMAKGILGGGLPPVVALILALLAGGGVGGISGFLIGKMNLPPFIATLGFLSIARGLSYRISGGVAVDLELQGQPSLVYSMLGGHSVLTAIFLGAVASVLMARFSGGRYVYAVGGNMEAARFSGLRVDAIRVWIYAIAGVFSGLAGCALLSRYGSAYVAMGNGYELQIIAACAIGGVSFSGGEGSVGGAMLGAVTLETLRVLLLQLHVPDVYIEIAYGAAVILAVCADQLRHGGFLNRWLGRRTA